MLSVTLQHAHTTMDRLEEKEQDLPQEHVLHLMDVVDAVLEDILQEIAELSNAVNAEDMDIAKEIA